jgi:hypothetical protein
LPECRCRVKGIFNGASFVFFSFIGFDCVSTLAEEVKNPAVDMPVGIVGCISFVTVVCKCHPGTTAMHMHAQLLSHNYMDCYHVNFLLESE